MRPVTCFAILSLSCLLAAAETPSNPTPGQPGFASRNPRYRIQTSDVLELNFRFTPEYNQTLTVQPDGFVALQGTEDLKLQGLTAPEALAAIRGRYAGILHEPVIALTLKEFEKPWFVVNGFVVRPGKFDLRGDVTLSDAIAIAGGFAPFARQGDVLLMRRHQGETLEVRKLDLKRLLAKQDATEDVRLQAGDSIYVAESKLGRFDRFMNLSRLSFFLTPVPALR
jgi:polysaccharide biosynthesis/export protein